MKLSMSSTDLLAPLTRIKETCSTTSSHDGSILQNSLVREPRKQLWVLLGQIPSIRVSCLVELDDGNTLSLMTTRNAYILLTRLLRQCKLIRKRIKQSRR